MNERREPRDPDGPCGARLPGYEVQPRFETLVMRGPRRFALTTQVPSGERVDVPLGRLSLEMRPDPPQP
jgi:hypothetical protein